MQAIQNTIFAILWFYFQTTILFAQEKPANQLSKSNLPITDSLYLIDLNNKALSLKSTNPYQAVQLLESVIKISKEKDHFYSLILAYSHLGSIYANLGDFERANSWYLKSYDIAFVHNNQMGMGRALNNMAIMAKEMKDFDKALAYARRAVDLHILGKQVELTGSSYLNLGAILREQGKFELALEQIKLGIEYLDSSDNIKLQIHAKLQLSNTLSISGQLDLAERELNNTKTLLDKYNYPEMQCVYFQFLGDFYLEKNMLSDALKAYQTAYKTAVGLKDLLQMAESIERLIQYHLKTKEYEQAYGYKTTYHHIIDSLGSGRNLLLLSRIELQEEFEEREQNQTRRNELKDQIQRTEIENQKRISGYLAIVLFFLILFGLRAYLTNRQKIKNARILENQRQEILLKNEALKHQSAEDLKKNQLIEQINKKNEILSLVVKETNNAVFILGPDGTIEWVNDAFEALYGFSLDEFIFERGSKIQEAIANDIVGINFNRCIQTKKPVNYIIRTQNRDKENIWVQTTLTPVFGKTNEIERLVAIDSNITEIKNAQDEINRKNDEITTSLEYASRIQQSLLPVSDEMDALFSGYFVINFPQSIVSGDFYWTFRKNGKTLAVIADSTGHGVPAAFMSLLGISSLQEIVYAMEDLEPSRILGLLRQKIVELLHHSQSVLFSSESWDIAIITIDTEKKLQYAGSNCPLLVVSNNVLIELKPDKFYIWDETINRDFTQRSLQLEDGDMVYMITDGFTDQFGGLEDKKFSRRKLKKLLLEIHKMPLPAQKEFLSKILINWRGRNDQLDDVLVMGLKI
jgi:PAS domain S-box-containing protein